MKSEEISSNTAGNSIQNNNSGRNWIDKLYDLIQEVKMKEKVKSEAPSPVLNEQKQSS